MFALHAHGVGEVVARELELHRVLGGRGVPMPFVDDFACALDALPLAVCEVSRPVDVTHFVGQDVDDLEIGVRVAVSAGHASLVHGNVDGVGDDVAEGDPLGLVRRLRDFELADVGDVVFGVRHGEKLVRHGEEGLRRRIDAGPARHERELAGHAAPLPRGVEVGAHEPELV